jgi:hypothetical protein
MNKPQATIQANLGTSDLAVLIENHGFLPLWYRSEPSENETQESWVNRSQIIVNKLCSELEVETREAQGRKIPFEFIKLTEKLFHAYKQEPDKWKNRLYPSRLLGIIEKAQEKFDISQINVFVTKQEPLFESDSLFLFEILHKWFKEEKAIELKPKFIPGTIDLSKDADSLSDYYYKQIQDIASTEIILISRKGGTPAMINALSQQIALSSIDRKIILIDPEFVVDKVLSGEPSPCKLTSYWKYIRIQKYETVQQLLERWDFDGAKVILKKWQEYIKDLIDLGVIDKEIQNNNSFLLKNFKVLDLTCAYFNLDSSGSSSYKIKKNEDLGIFSDFEYKDSDRLPNLYAQCLIFGEINQVANFLFRLACFGEEVLHYLIENLDSAKYFDKKKHPDNWVLRYNLKNIQHDLWLNFRELEEKTNFTKTFENWLKECNTYKLSSRYSQRNFLEALIKYKGDKKKINLWNEICDDLEKIDYWVDLRNRLTHSAEGVSKEGMSKIFQKDLRDFEKAKADADKKEKQVDYNNYPSINKNVSWACKRDEILNLMRNIKQNAEKLGNYNSRFDSDYFIYDEVRKQVIEDLMSN